MEAEVKTSLMRERSKGGRVLFPIRIDDVVLQPTEGWAAQLHEWHMSDFRFWKDDAMYWVAFQRLLRDLRAGYVDLATPMQQRRQEARCWSRAWLSWSIWPMA